MMGLIDLEEHTCHFLPSLYKEIAYLTDKIQGFLDTKEGSISSRLSELTDMLLS